LPATSPLLLPRARFESPSCSSSPSPPPARTPGPFPFLFPFFFCFFFFYRISGGVQLLLLPSREVYQIPSVFFFFQSSWWFYWGFFEKMGPPSCFPALVALFPSPLPLPLSVFFRSFFFSSHPSLYSFSSLCPVLFLHCPPLGFIGAFPLSCERAIFLVIFPQPYYPRFRSPSLLTLFPNPFFQCSDLFPHLSLFRPLPLLGPLSPPPLFPPLSSKWPAFYGAAKYFFSPPCALGPFSGFVGDLPMPAFLLPEGPRSSFTNCRTPPPGSLIACRIARFRPSLFLCSL